MRFLLLLPLLFLLGCEEIKVNMRIIENFDLVAEDGKVKTFKEGWEEVKVTVNERKKRIEMTYKGDNGNWRTKKIHFKHDPNYQLPTQNGEFLLPSNTNGQAFDLYGEVNTDVEETDTVYDTEMCTYLVREWVCEWHNGHQECDWEWVWKTGQREVEYHWRITITRLFASIGKPGTESAVADAQGDRETREKIYDYEGRCY